MDEAHRKNADFEQQLAFVRQERDTALNDVQSWQRSNATLESEAQARKQELETLQGQHATLSTEHQETQERYNMANIEIAVLKQEVEKLKGERARVQMDLENIQKILTPQPRNEYGQFGSAAE
jgi:chromosome segregation ATPase